LFQHEDNEGSELTNDEMKHWIGGTIILKGSKKYGHRIDKILELMVLCHNHDAEDVQNALRNSRRTSKSSWLGWLMKHKTYQPNSIDEDYRQKEVQFSKSSTISSTSINTTNTDDDDDVV
ncbi:unnamed protein product, partial [Rhizophagus irregularis]